MVDFTKRNSDFIFGKKSGSKRVLVWFCSIDTPPGRFELFNTIARHFSDYLIVNCRNNSWYLEGIPGLGGFREAVDFIKKSVSEYEERVFAGNSMGAYGALLYGALAGADTIVAYGPEILPGVPFGKYSLLASRNEYHLYNIFDIFGKQMKVPRIHVLLGEKASYDAIGTLFMPENSQTRLYSVKNAFHSLISVFYEEFYKQIDNACAGKNLISTRFGRLLDFPDIISSLYVMHRKNSSKCIVKRDVVNFHGLYLANKARYGYLGSYFASELAKMMLHIGMKKEAHKILIEGIECNRDDIEPWHLISARGLLESGANLTAIGRFQIDNALMTQPAYRNKAEHLSKRGLI